MTAWVGLTGGIGSGKSQAAAEFARLGVPVKYLAMVSELMPMASNTCAPQ